MILGNTLFCHFLNLLRSEIRVIHSHQVGNLLSGEKRAMMWNLLGLLLTRTTGLALALNVQLRALLRYSILATSIAIDPVCVMLLLHAVSIYRVKSLLLRAGEGRVLGIASRQPRDSQ